ncbi:MAG: DUF305 domain-containing protein [Bacteroidota bacterium]|nr:DUF305 domain-containing protein [Bacteroidota bacterium]
MPMRALVLAGGLLTMSTICPAQSTEDLESLFWARQDSVIDRFSEADVAFMTGMIGHHAQALIMSRLAPENGASPAVQTLAARIINAQNDEIRIMQRWLEDRGQSVPQVHIEGLNLMIHTNGHHDGHHDMPGMLTMEQLQELEQAQGADFDRLFLRYMIQHHRGAVTMVRDLLATDGAVRHDATYKLATDIHVDQITEIERMQQMLAATITGQ